MIITKLHLGIALFASAYLYYSNQPLVQNELPSYFKSNNKPHYKKASLTEKSMLIFACNAIFKRKGMALISHFRWIKLA
jgi:hypothetical protein